MSCHDDAVDFESFFRTNTPSPQGGAVSTTLLPVREADVAVSQSPQFQNEQLDASILESWENCAKNSKFKSKAIQNKAIDVIDLFRDTAGVPLRFDADCEAKFLALLNNSNQATLAEFDRLRLYCADENAREGSDGNWAASTLLNNKKNFNRLLLHANSKHCTDTYAPPTENDNRTIDRIRKRNAAQSNAALPPPSRPRLAPIAPLSTTLSLSEYASAMEERVMRDEIDLTLLTFMKSALDGFADVRTTGDMLRAFPRDDYGPRGAHDARGANDRDKLRSWLQRGQLWAKNCGKTDSDDYRVHEARRVAINCVFFSIDAALTAAGRDVNTSLIGEAFAFSADALRKVAGANGAVTTATVVRREIDKVTNTKSSRFLSGAKRAVMMALPLDAFFALFQAKKHWFSKRHWHLMSAATRKVGCAELGVEVLVKALSAKPSLDNTMEQCIVSAMAEAGVKMPLLYDYAAKEMNGRANVARLEKVAGEVGLDDEETLDAVDTMMNKRYELAFALAFSQDEVAAFRWFNMPLFWLPFGGDMHVCCVDLTRLPLSLCRLS